MRRALTFTFVTALATPAAAQDIWATPETAKPAAVATDARPAPPPPPATPPAQPAFETVSLEAQTYDARVLLGLRQIVLRDFDGAIATLRRAAQLEPGSPAAFCHLGDAQLEKGDLAEAKAGYESCARFASMANQARYTTLAYVGLARVAERDPRSEPRERRDAWARAKEGVVEPSAKAMAAARLATYEAAVVRESQYEGVRRRIVEREVARESASD